MWDSEFTVVGKITNQFQWDSQGNPSRPVVFLSFGDWKGGSFRLVLWSETLKLFSENFLNMRSYELRWVSVSGLLLKYTKGTRTHPQIIIEAPSEIELLPGGEREAKARLGLSTNRKSVATISSKTPPLVQQNQPTSVHHSTTTPASTDAISDLYKDWPTTPPPIHQKARPPQPVQRSTRSKTRPTVPAPKRASPIRPLTGPPGVPPKRKHKKKWWEFWK